jgi:hypothetical protein
MDKNPEETAPGSMQALIVASSVADVRFLPELVN